MMKPIHYILKLIEAENIDERKAILRMAAVDGCTDLFEYFQIAYSKRHAFGITSAPRIEGDFTPKELSEQGTFKDRDFIDLLGKILRKELVGDDLKKALIKAAENANILEWNMVYRSILLKNMKCKVTPATINKILREMGGKANDFIIPTWKVQEAKMMGNLLPKWNAGLEPCLNGQRAIVVLDSTLKYANIYDKKGNVISDVDNFLKPFDSILQATPMSIVIDGEIVNEKYAIYDLLPLGDFENNECPLSLQERHDGLLVIGNNLQEQLSRDVYILPKLKVDLNTDAGVQKTIDFQKEMADEGYESIIIKNMDAPYEAGKSGHWLKWKGDTNVSAKTKIDDGTEDGGLDFLFDD